MLNCHHRVIYAIDMEISLDSMWNSLFCFVNERSLCQFPEGC